MNSSTSACNIKPLFCWIQDPGGGDQGILTLWPGTPREMQLRVDDFRTANTLGMRINSVRKEAFENGRRSMRDEVASIVP